MKTLYPHQNEFYDRLRASMRRNRRVLGVLPTGGGKTEVFFNAAYACVKKGMRCLVLVHRTPLLEQTSARCEMGHGCIAPGYKVTSHPLQIGMVQSVGRRDMFGFDLIIVDEAHRVLASGYKRVLERNPRAYVLGMTATPQRGDGRGLGEMFDDMIVGPDAEWLTEKGYLSRVKVYVPGVINTSKVSRAKGDFVTRELESVASAQPIVADAVGKYRKWADGKRALVSCVSVDHCKLVAVRFQEAGYRFKAVWGDMSNAERREAITGLADYTYQGLVYCDLFSEGVDCPSVECGIFMRPTLSLALWDQQVGRIKRRSATGEAKTLIDLTGNTHRYGLAEWGRQWSLDTPKRRAVDEPVFQTRTCPDCYGVHKPVATCPYCGHVYQAESYIPSEVEAEMMEMTRETLMRQRAHAAHVLKARAEKMERLYA